MSRTRHLTHQQFIEGTGPLRRRAPSRLTKHMGDWYHPNVDRPENNGSWPGGVGFNAGQRRRKQTRVSKLHGRRRDRRRRDREILC